MVDFGSAIYEISETPSSSYQPQNPSYRAPEVLLQINVTGNKKQPLTNAADIWSLCLLVNRLYYGKQIQDGSRYDVRSGEKKKMREIYEKHAKLILEDSQFELMDDYPEKAPRQAEAVSIYFVGLQYQQIFEQNSLDSDGFDFFKNHDSYKPDYIKDDSHFIPMRDLFITTNGKTKIKHFDIYDEEYDLYPYNCDDIFSRKFNCPVLRNVYSKCAIANFVQTGLILDPVKRKPDIDKFIQQLENMMTT